MGLKRKKRRKKSIKYGTDLNLWSFNNIVSAQQIRSTVDRLQSMATYSESGAYYNAMDPGAGSSKEAQMWANAYLGAATLMEPLQALQNVQTLPASGIQNVELSVIDPHQWEYIPKEKFDEMRRLAELNIRSFVKEGKPSPITIHSPLRGLSPEGFDAQAGRWNEEKRQKDEAFFKDVVNKAVQLGPSVPVTIHGSAIEAPSMLAKFDPNTGKFKQLEWMNVVDPESGQLQHIKRETVHYPTGDVTHEPMDRLNTRNVNFWDEQVRGMNAVFSEIARLEQQAQWLASQGRTEESNRIQHQINIMSHNYAEHTSAVFDRGVKALEVAKQSSFFNKDEKQHYEKILGQFRQFQNEFKGRREEAPAHAAEFLSKLHQNILQGKEPAPPVYVPWEDFAREKASTTFANLAMHSIDVARNPKKFGLDAKPLKAEQAPVIAVENVLPEGAFGTGETLRQVIVESRKKFEAEAPKRLGISQSEAKKLGDKLIGATWDIGHINMYRKYLTSFGYNEEQIKKKIAEENKAIMKDIRHIQVSDNFGFDDAHMAPGMGNVPIKEFMQQVAAEKSLAGVRTIIEHGSHVTTWRENPTLHNLRYFNTPVYGFQNAPTWNEVGGSYFMGSGGYSPGYGTILPPWHFAEYGSGFAQIPTALGAPLPGQQQASRFSGAPVS